MGRSTIGSQCQAIFSQIFAKVRFEIALRPLPRDAAIRSDRHVFERNFAVFGLLSWYDGRLSTGTDKLPPMSHFSQPLRLVAIRPRTPAFQLLASCLLGLLLATVAQAQLRIVTYNTATSPPTQTARPGLSTVLQAIGAESVNGIAKPVDVLLLQEQNTSLVSIQSIVTILNDFYGAGTYGYSNLVGETTGAGVPGLVYNTNTVQLIGQTYFGDVGSSDGTGGGGNEPPAQQSRSTLRYQLRPVGYDASADFYAYNSHYKSSTGTGPNNQRLVEAQAIRTNADALGQGAHIIYVGDFNIQNSSQPMYQHLLSSGPGQAFDPINVSGTWNNNDAVKHTHTQSPATATQFPGQTTGGMDDRFDFQLVSGEMNDGLGLSYIPGSYRAFGNNGTHECCDSPITSGTGYTPTILNALMTASDHIPVVADYQVPAIMQVIAGSIPTTLELGQTFNLNVNVSNSANVVAAIGADLLRYSLTTTGSVSGTFLNRTDAALGGSNNHLVSFNTATAGLKTGNISIVSTSQQVFNGTVNIPISYRVVMPGDYNGDGIVNAADYAIWRDTLHKPVAVGEGADGSLDGVINLADYNVWRRNFGDTMGSAAGMAVPEPTGTSVLALSMLSLYYLIGNRGGTRHANNPSKAR